MVETDVIVLGSGPGGYVAAIRAAQLGKKVTLIEESDKLGGICLNYGCIPTKAIIHASNFFSSLKDFEEMGIKINDYAFDLEKLGTWKNGIIEKLNNGIKSLLDKYGIKVIKGKGIFVNSNELKVESSSIIFKKAIIATGSSPIEIPGFSFDNPNVWSSKEALLLNEVPKKLVIIGGGYIGTEMGTVYAKLGSEVHIVEMKDRLLPEIDKEIVSVVSKKLSEFNVRLHLKSKALGMEEKDGNVTVKIEEKEIECDKVLVVVGRKPNSNDIGLENTKVKVNDKGFIEVNESRNTFDPNIYAVGDVIGQPMLAHKASKDGKIAAESICGLQSKFDNVIPFVIFNDPEIASVGIKEEDAKCEILIGKFPFSALGRAMTLNSTEGFVKIIAEKKTKKVLGVHIVGAGASDMIAEATLAIDLGATLDDIASTIHAHPTMPESLSEAAEVAMGKAVHIFNVKN